MMEVVTKTIDECFAELIEKRAWHRGSPYDRKNANYHKKIFLQGKLPDEVKREYLESAGYKLVQAEMWSND